MVTSRVEENDGRECVAVVSQKYGFLARDSVDEAEGWMQLPRNLTGYCKAKEACVKQYYCSVDTQNQKPGIQEIVIRITRSRADTLL